MKYLRLLVICLVCFSSSFVYAAKDKTTFHNRFFAGLDYERHMYKVEPSLTIDNVRINTTGMDNSNNGYSIFAGYRWVKFGLQFGYTFLQNINYANTKEEGGTVFLDALWFHPVAPRFDLKALLGVGTLRTELNNPSFWVSATRGGVRAGVGVAYKLSNLFSVDAMYIYQSGNQLIKNDNILSLAFIYYI